MAQLTHQQYDALEQAIRDGRRVALMRRGTEYVVVALALTVEGGREALQGRRPTTGETTTFYIDELDTLEVVT